MITVDGKKSFDLSSGQYSPAQQKLNRSLRFNKILLFKNKASIIYESRVPYYAIKSIFTLHDVGITGNKYML